MINLTKSIAVATAAILITFSTQTASNAADAVNRSPAPDLTYDSSVPLASWSGLYGGVVFGYGFGETRSAAATVKPKGMVGGLFAGGQWQSGAIVYGGEADVTYDWSKGSSAGVSVKGGLEGSLRARLGYAISEDFLAYATAGLALSRTAATGGGVSQTKTLIGWTAGAGIDAKLTEKVFSRVEYRFTDYGNRNFNLGAPTSISTHNHKIMIGLGVRF